MPRRKRHPEHVNHDRWLVSYADFITLLFAFFVMMFAASNSDQKKAGKIATAVQVAFRDLSIFDPSGKVVPLYDEGGLPGDTTSVVGNTHSVFDARQLVASGNGWEGEIRKVRAQLEELLKEETANHTVRLSEDSRGLTISLAEAGFYDPGSAVMPPKALTVVDRIAGTLQPLSYGIRVEGHTDNSPIHTAQFPSNWELSTARATFLLQYLISTSAIPPQRLSAVGYGEYRPLARQETPEGRARNRRGDLLGLGAAAEKLQ